MFVESMESRRLFSVSTTSGLNNLGAYTLVPDASAVRTPVIEARLTKTGSLYITGSTSADRFVLREVNKLLAIEWRSQIDGKSIVLNNRSLAFEAKNVKRIFVDGRAGRDIVDVQLRYATSVTLDADPKDTLIRENYIRIADGTFSTQLFPLPSRSVRVVSISTTQGSTANLFAIEVDGKDELTSASSNVFVDPG